MLNKRRSLSLALLATIGLATAAPVQAINFGDMMNPGKWMGGKKDRYDGPPPGYGYDQPYGPQGGYYGQPGGPGYGPGYGAGGYPGGGYPGPGFDPSQQGYAPAAPAYSAPAAGPAPGEFGGPSDQRIQQLEQRIQQLEQQLRNRR